MPNAINELSSENINITSTSNNSSLPENHNTSHLSTDLIETTDLPVKPPAIIPIPSFTVLHNDSLNLSSKPNAIVRPIRRIVPVVGQEDPSDHCPTPKDGQEVEHFAKALNRKLIRLRNANVSVKSQHSSKNGSNASSLDKRPLFITTVPTGVFLPPSKEPPKRLYAFATHPQIYSNSNGHKDKLNRTSDKEQAIRLHGIKAFSHFLGTIKARGEKDPCEPFKNIMFDRRVVRGTNYAPPVPEEDPCSKEAEFRRRQCLRRRCRERNRRNIIGTPPPVDGRRHERIQTEKYLEELYERPPEYDANTQTDLYLERPLTPPFIPQKIGIDAATEILEGELFDFDLEVEPLLETLVGHCVEQGILEVSHEEEIADIQRQQQEFRTNRDTELAELRRLEAQELRLEAEKQRRKRQDEIAKELDIKLQKGVTAAKLLQGHIASLLPDVLANLEPATDEARKIELERNICPWLTKEVAEEVGHIVDSREILTAIITEIIKHRATIYAGYSEEEPQAEEEEEEMQIGME